MGGRLLRVYCVLLVNIMCSSGAAPLLCHGNSFRGMSAVRQAGAGRPCVATASGMATGGGGGVLKWGFAGEASGEGARPCPTTRQLRLRGGHRAQGVKRRDTIDKVRTSRRIHSIARPRNARKAAERRARMQEEAASARNVSSGVDGGQGAEEPPKAVNRDLFRRNMGEWVVEIAKFKKEHPAVYEEELNTRIDSEVRYMIRQWRETIQMPTDDEEELDIRTCHPDWVKMRAISHYNLAMCHDTGFGVGMSQRSAVTSFQHYLAAAELGHPEAMCCAGSCFMYGKGVQRDVEAAVGWYLRAAMEGSAEGSYDAMFNLGMCFRKGVGRPQVYVFVSLSLSGSLSLALCLWLSGCLRAVPVCKSAPPTGPRGSHEVVPSRRQVQAPRRHVRCCAGIPPRVWRRRAR